MERYRLVDLSIPLRPGALTFPGDPPVEVEGPYSAVPGPVREYCYRLHFPTQAGTHIQGPHYFLAEGRRIDACPLACFEGEALVVDVRGRQRFGVEELTVLAGGALAGRIVLFHTGYMARLLAAPTSKELAALVAAKPGLTPEAARWLAAQSVQLVGIDSVGLEPGGDPMYPVNLCLCQHEMLILEGLVNLELLPPRGAWVEAFPLPIAGVEGTPCRAVARVPL